MSSYSQAVYDVVHQAIAEVDPADDERDRFAIVGALECVKHDFLLTADQGSLCIMTEPCQN
jgi:hypothetical protein